MEFAEIYDIHFEVRFLFPCRKLVWVGFKLTPSCLPCTSSKRVSYLANTEMCLEVHRIKWPRSLSHRHVDCSWSSFWATAFISHHTNFWPIQTKMSYWTKKYLLFLNAVMLISVCYLTIKLRLTFRLIPFSNTDDRVINIII